MPIKKGSKRTWTAGSPKIEDGKPVHVVLSSQNIAYLIERYGKVGHGMREIIRFVEEQQNGRGAGTDSLQRAAHILLTSALTGGAISRPERCENCKKTATHTLHGHHDDYSFPLDVIWLCSRCHIARHKELGWGKNGRPSLPDREKMVTKMAKLRPDQLVWLNSQPNGNKTIRDLIDGELSKRDAHG